MAVKVGEAREETTGGWFTAARSSWVLPPQLLPLAQVRHSDLPSTYPYLATVMTGTYLPCG